MTENKQLKMTGERAVPGDVRTIVEYVQLLRHEFVYRQVQKLLKPEDRVLEIGFGEGYGTELLSESCLEIIGIDVEQEVVPYANDKYGSDKCKFQYYEGGKLPFESSSFDAVVTFQVIEHIKDDKAFVSEISRVLKPGGTLYVTTPNKATRLKPGEKPWNRFHVREYYAKELQELLAGIFPDAHVYGINATESIREMEFARMKRKGIIGLALKFGVRRIIPQAFDPFFARLIGIVRGYEKVDKSNQDVKGSYSLKDFWIDKENIDESLDLIGFCPKN